MMIHHHGSIKNLKHCGFLPNKIHQQTFHSKCRHHPYRFLRHGRTRTRPLVIQSFRRHLGSTKLHHRHQHPVKIFCLQPLRSTKLHHSKRHRSQKLRPFHLWQSGDPAHFISRTLYRSVGDPIRCIPRRLCRPQRLHSFGGVQVSCVPCAHFEGFEANNQTPLGSECETASIGSSSGNVNSFGEKLCASRLFSQDVLHEKVFILLQSLQRLSVCCMGPWHVNGRNGRSTRQHCR